MIGGAQPEQGNTVQLNGGWGIYAVGAIDRGNNFAAGNMEPGQCYGVVCRIGAPPGAPDTWIVEHPPALTSSRNASFTYNGHDEVTPITELVFECRLDTSNDLAWEDCEYPMQYSNLAPGHHKFEVRAIDLNGSGLADHSPASWSWTYQPGAPGDPPDTFIDLGPPAETWLPETIFTYHADEPDVTFECKVDDFPYETCSFDELVNAPSAGWEVALEETQFGLHTFYVRARDFEGNVDPTPAAHTVAAARDPDDGHLRPGLHAAGDAVRPGRGRPDALERRDDHVRGERRRRDLRVLARPRAVRAVHVARPLREPDDGRAPAPHPRDLGQPGDERARAGRVRVGGPRAGDERAADGHDRARSLRTTRARPSSSSSAPTT